MYHETFEKLELEEIATILDRITPILEGTVFDPLETTIMATDLNFYPGCRLLDISNQTMMPPVRRFVIYSPKKSAVLNFFNDIIYKFNDEWPISLSEETVISYIRFFLSFVRGKNGRFIVVENVDDVPWKDEPPPSARQAVGRIIKPVTLKDIDGKGIYRIKAHMVFKDSLFTADIAVEQNGLVSISNEELLVEDMPVVDDTFGQ